MPRVILTVVTCVTHRLVQLSARTPHHPATCHHKELSCHLYDRIACTVSMPCGTVRTVQSSPFFACFGFRTEHYIFHIRSPFDEVNIWLESGRQDRRNGASFIRFRVFSYLNIF
jgi:hypothetical protein